MNTGIHVVYICWVINILSYIRGFLKHFSINFWLLILLTIENARHVWGVCGMSVAVSWAFDVEALMVIVVLLFVSAG